MSEILLDKKENQKLEFKSKDVLDDLAAVGKGVVGMLNASGGDLWIGIAEEGSRAVKVEPIDDLDLVVRRVRDYLIDTIEPSPTEDEVLVESVKEIIRISIKPTKKKKPYAHVRSSGRVFVIRVGDRLRPMTRNEIADYFKGSRDEQNKDEESFHEEWKEFLKDKPAGLCMLVKPLEQIDLDIQNEQIKKYLQDATSTGNRPGGWNFTNPYLEIRPKNGGLVLGAVEKGQLEELHSNGDIIFFIDIVHLQSGEPDNRLHPFPLMEYPVSIFRLAKVLYQDKLENDAQIMVNLAMLGINGWILRPGSPDSIDYITYDRLYKPHVFGDAKDFILSEPKKFPWKEVSENPDYCGIRLVKSMYEAFGLYEKDMPAEYDRINRKLVFER